MVKMVDVDVQVDPVGEVVGGGEGTEAAGEGVMAVEGEDFKNECEIEIGVVRRNLGSQIEIEIGIGIGMESERRVVVGVEEEGGEREEEEWKQLPLWSYHYSSAIIPGLA